MKNGWYDLAWETIWQRQMSAVQFATQKGYENKWFCAMELETESLGYLLENHEDRELEGHLKGWELEDAAIRASFKGRKD